MEFNDLVLLVVLNGLCSLVFSLIFAFVVAYFRDRQVERRLTQVENDMDSIVDSENGKAGQIAKHEKAGRIAMAEAEIGAALAAGKQPMEVLKEVGPKYLDIAPDLLKKYARVVK